MFRLNFYYKRYYRHMNQTEFAQFLGLSQSFVSQLLKGTRKPSADVLFQISDKLKVPVEKLYIRKIS